VSRVRVVIVDDHSIFRSGLRSDLDAGIEVAGEAADVAGAVEAIVRERMGGAADLSVPLDVQVGRGRDWNEAAH